MTAIVTQTDNICLHLCDTSDSSYATTVVLPSLKSLSQVKALTFENLDPCRDIFTIYPLALFINLRVLRLRFRTSARILRHVASVLSSSNHIETLEVVVLIDCYSQATKPLIEAIFLHGMPTLRHFSLTNNEHYLVRTFIDFSQLAITNRQLTNIRSLYLRWMTYPNFLLMLPSVPQVRSISAGLLGYGSFRDYCADLCLSHCRKLMLVCDVQIHYKEIDSLVSECFPNVKQTHIQTVHQGYWD